MWMNGPASARFWNIQPPLVRLRLIDPPEARHSTTQIAMIPIVTTGSPPYIDAAVWTFVRCLAHSGQRMPADVAVMQSGQIGRPQFEQETPVSRLGWR